MEKQPSLISDHLLRLSDDTAIFEHARGLTPRRECGYATEDAARALIVTVRWLDGWEAVERLTGIYLAMVHHAITAEGWVRARLNFDRRWQDSWSGDGQGRALWGVGIAAAEARRAWQRESALEAFERLALPDDPSLRPHVYAALGVTALCRTYPDHRRASQMAETIAARLPPPLAADWIWPEPRLTYDNARLPEAYLALGHLLADSRLQSYGLDMLTWLIKIETSDRGFSFTPVEGRDPSTLRPGYDQQPLEATAMLDACLQALVVTGDRVWEEPGRMAVAWFMGHNDRGTPLYDPTTGAGHDALTLKGINTNAGAESTVAALWALQRWPDFARLVTMP